MLPPMTGVLLLAFAVPFAAAQQPERTSLEKVRVRCVDADGKPVAGAEVHLFQSRRRPDGTNDLHQTGPHRSGDDGVAVTAVALDWDGGKFDRWAYARVPGELVGATRMARWDDGPGWGSLDVTLHPSRELRGAVRVPDGVDATAARVRILVLSALVGGSPGQQPFPRQHGIASLERALPERFDTAPEADGTFVLRDLPPQPLLVLGVEGPGFGLALWGNALLPDRAIPDLVEIAVERDAPLRGTVTAPDGRVVAGAALELRIAHEARSPLLYSFRARADDAGRFRIDGACAGPFDLTVESPAGVTLPRRVTLTRGDTTTVDVALASPVELAGVVAAADRGPGIEGVGVVVVTGTDSSLRVAGARTDAQGRFRMRVPEGGLRLYLGAVPAGFARPDPSWTMPLDVRAGDAALQHLRLELQPAK